MPLKAIRSPGPTSRSCSFTSGAFPTGRLTTSPKRSKTSPHSGASSSDGTGRVGRLLLNLHFLKHSWPPVHVLPADRLRYLRCLDRAHAEGLTDLVSFLREAMARSLLDLLDQVGTREDELKPLKVLATRGSYSAKYLSLRAGQGVLPALKIGGDWRTSPRAHRLYSELVGRTRGPRGSGRSCRCKARPLSRGMESPVSLRA